MCTYRSLAIVVNFFCFFFSDFGLWRILQQIMANERHSNAITRKIDNGIMIANFQRSVMADVFTKNGSFFEKKEKSKSFGPLLSRLNIEMNTFFEKIFWMSEIYRGMK